MYEPIRGGTRGGRDQFKWEDLRKMSQNDREQFLGFTTQIGYLDKGGKWRKKDWYAHADDKKQTQSDYAKELKAEQERDELRMKQALGLAPKKEEKISKKETEQMLERIKDHGDNLTQMQRNEVDQMYDGERQQGLGFKLSAKDLQQKANKKLEDGTIANVDLNVYRLEGEKYNGNLGGDYEQAVIIKKKEVQMEDKEIIEKSKKIKKEKKHKKDKKNKKDKKKKRQEKEKEEVKT